MATGDTASDPFSRRGQTTARRDPSHSQGRPRSWPARARQGSNIIKEHGRAPRRDAQTVRPSTAGRDRRSQRRALHCRRACPWHLWRGEAPKGSLSLRSPHLRDYRRQGLPAKCDRRSKSYHQASSGLFRAGPARPASKPTKRAQFGERNQAACRYHRWPAWPSLEPRDHRRSGVTTNYDIRLFRPATSMHHGEQHPWASSRLPWHSGLLYHVGRRSLSDRLVARAPKMRRGALPRQVARVRDVLGVVMQRPDAERAGCVNRRNQDPHDSKGLDRAHGRYPIRPIHRHGKNAQRNRGGTRAERHVLGASRR
jgi:hypothetical protein